MTFAERIQSGLQGHFTGLKNGLKRANKYLFGIQRGCYYLFGGLSGSGKTTLVDYMLLNAIQDAEKQGIAINIIYYSLEIDEMTKRANWLSVLIYEKYGVIILPEKIKGLGEFRLSTEEQRLVESELENLDKIFSKIHWIFESMNPTGMYKSWWEFMSARGTFVYEDYKDESGETKQRIVKFLASNPKEYNLVICDHIALCKRERGFDLKQNLDKLSEYAVRCRNLYGMTFLFLQQFNMSLNSVDRQKFKGVDISPSQSDFKDSTNPYTDSDVAIGLLNAHKMDMETCLGYNINSPSALYNLKDRFRMLKIIKNRLSRDNIAIGLLFLPEAGRFDELPKVEQITSSDITRFQELQQGR